MSGPLAVPIRHVTKGSNLCQVSTALMVMEYLGDARDKAETESELGAFEPYVRTGKERHSQGVAIWLAGQGYDVRFAHHDLSVLDADMLGLTEKDADVLRRKLEEIPDTDENAFRRKKIGLDLQVIDAGVRYSTSLLDLEFVDEQLARDVPVVLTAVRHNALYPDPTDRSNHAIVVIGKEGDEYLYNDCNRDEAVRIGANQLLQAWYATGAYLMTVQKAA